MSRGLRIVVIVVLVLLVGALGALGAMWFQRTFERVEETLYLPPMGEAAYNPLYALKRTLEIDGVRVNARQRLALDAHPLAPGDTVLLFNDARALTRPQRDRLMEWVDGGGHLLLRTPPRSQWSEITVPLLSELGIAPTGENRCARFHLQGEDPHVEFCRGQRFRMEIERELAWGDVETGYVFARLPYGDGHVDVLADFDVMTNRGSQSRVSGLLDKPPRDGLSEPTHAALARQFLAPNYGKGTMHLIYAAEAPSLFRTVLKQGWMVWIPLTLALLAWLWSRMLRFGPLIPTPAMERRSLLEHVRASGDLLFRYHRGVLLYVAVRQAFLLRLRRRDPVAAALAGDAQIEAIAARLSWPIETVRKAMQAPSSRDHAAFRDRISTLIELRNRL